MVEPLVKYVFSCTPKVYITEAMKFKTHHFFTFLLTFIFSSINAIAQYDGEYYEDEEDYLQRQQWSNFEFENFEIGMIILGIILLAISIPKLNNKEKSKEPGCAIIAMMIFGIICISPVISGILTIVGNILGEIVKLGFYVAFIAGAIYLISSLIKKD